MPLVSHSIIFLCFRSTVRSTSMSYKRCISNCWSHSIGGNVHAVLVCACVSCIWHSKLVRCRPDDKLGIIAVVADRLALQFHMVQHGCCSCAGPARSRRERGCPEQLRPQGAGQVEDLGGASVWSVLGDDGVWRKASVQHGAVSLVSLAVVRREPRTHQYRQQQA